MKAAKARRRPTQARAQATYDAILEAAAQVLVADGFDHASTNRLAQVAGVSVGSLYQYFGNKEGVYTALIEQHCDKQVALLQQMVGALGSAPLTLAVKAYIQAMIASHEQDRPVHRALSQQAAHLGLEPLRRVHAESRRVVRAYLEAHRDAILPRDLDLTAFVLVGMVEGIVDSAFFVEDADLNWAGLAHEIERAVLRYLLGPEAPCDG